MRLPGAFRSFTQLTSSLLTRKTNALHLVAVFTPQSGVEALEVRVAAGDDGRSLVAAAGLDHVDRVQLERHRDENQAESTRQQEQK